MLRIPHSVNREFMDIINRLGCTYNLYIEFLPLPQLELYSKIYNSIPKLNSALFKEEDTPQRYKAGVDKDQHFLIATVE
jgi:hypothetical protein